MKDKIAGTGAGELARCLKQMGVKRVFGLCADQTNSVFYALALEEIEIIGTRHETGAVHMAEGWARASGEPAVAIVGGGPGFINSVAGIAVAQWSATPVIVIAGQPPLRTRDRNGHQIIYQADIVRSLTKWSQEVAHPNIVAEFVSRAFQIATAGKPGPVCLSIPLNVMDGAVDAAAQGYRVAAPAARRAVVSNISGGAVEPALALLNRATRPVMIIGNTACWEGAQPRLAQLVGSLGIPAFTFESARGLIPDDGEICFGYAHSNYNMTFRELKDADLIVLAGAEMAQHTSEGKRPLVGADTQIIQLHPDAEQIGICKASDATIIAPVTAGLAALDAGLDSAARKRQRAWFDHIRKKYAADRKEVEAMPAKLSAGNAAIHPLSICASFRRHLTDRIRIAIDGGDFANWARIFFQPRRPGYCFDKSEMGSLGISLPIGIGAQLGNPAEQTWVFIGDGGFGFNGLELSTAVEFNLPLKVIVGNDQGWGVERRLQKAHYGRSIAADLPDIRYDKLAEVLGATGMHVDDPARLDAVVDEFVALKGPALLNVAMQREAGRAFVS